MDGAQGVHLCTIKTIGGVPLGLRLELLLTPEVASLGKAVVQELLAEHANEWPGAHTAVLRWCMEGVRTECIDDDDPQYS